MSSSHSSSILPSPLTPGQRGRDQRAEQTPAELQNAPSQQLRQHRHVWLFTPFLFRRNSTLSLHSKDVAEPLQRAQAKPTLRTCYPERVLNTKNTQLSKHAIPFRAPCFSYLIYSIKTPKQCVTQSSFPADK